jgi:hypothetical protein
LQHLDISQPDAPARLLHRAGLGQLPADDAESVADRAGQRGLVEVTVLAARDGDETRAAVSGGAECGTDRSG